MDFQLINYLPSIICSKYNKTSLDSKAGNKTIGCAKLNELDNRWYVTENATLVDESYVCNVTSLSYFSIIFTPTRVIESLLIKTGNTDNNRTKSNPNIQTDLSRFRRLNIYDKVLNVISIILGVITLVIFLLFTSVQKLRQKVTAFVNLSLTLVLLSLNLLLCFGTLFFSPGEKDFSGCLAVAFLQHFLISSLFTITTWGSILIFSSLLRHSQAGILNDFITILNSKSRYLIIQTVGLVTISLFFPVLFISIAASKNILYSDFESDVPKSKFAYFQMRYLAELEDSSCFLHHATGLYKIRKLCVGILRVTVRSNACLV